LVKVARLPPTPGGAPQSAGHWVDNDLNSLATNPDKKTAVPGSALDGYWESSDNSQHVNFIDGSGHVHELIFAQSASHWVDNDLTAFSGGPPATTGSKLCAYWMGSDSSQQSTLLTAKKRALKSYTSARKSADAAELRPEERSIPPLRGT
jgi:hypothetical protein